MGFLKRLFSLKSIGSKKKQKQEQKKQQEQQQQDQRRQFTLNSNEELQIIDDQEHEAAVGRLLRSSSARFAVVSELDYASLPPLPHPINDVIPTPTTSTISLSSSSTSHRGTYTVQVHKRKRHASTEFPFANRHLDDVRTPQRTRGATAPPKEYVNYLGLRSDPSVASLLELYDEHGQLPEKAFSNSPPSPPPSERNYGRAQTRRSGSTLRQLLGVPSNREKSDSSTDLTEGDISWAERFLGESDSVSSQSSLPLRTPTTPQTCFIDKPSYRTHVPNDESTDHDLSSCTVDNPALNSLEVELSMGSTSSVNLDSILDGTNPYISASSKSPQRASQVFKFLTQKRLPNIGVEQLLPRVMKTCRSSSGSSSILTRNTYDNASQLSCEHAPHTATPIPLRKGTPTSDYDNHSRPNSGAFKTPNPSSRISSPLPDRSRSTTSNIGFDQSSHYNPETGDDGHPLCRNEANANEVKVLMTGPTKVIVTAPTPSAGRDTPSRIPRGPRGPPQKRSSGNLRNRPLMTELSNSRSSSPSTRDGSGIPRAQKHRRTSGCSSSSESNPSTIRAVKSAQSKSDSVSSRTSFSSIREKENRSALSVRTDLPATPMRSHTIASDSRSLFRAIVTPSGYRPSSVVQPSPASSSELSPVGRQLMTDVRQQRMKAREAERERNKRRSERASAYVA